MRSIAFDGDQEPPAAAAASGDESIDGPNEAHAERTNATENGQAPGASASARDFDALDDLPPPPDTGAEIAPQAEQAAVAEPSTSAAPDAIGADNDHAERAPERDLDHPDLEGDGGSAGSRDFDHPGDTAGDSHTERADVSLRLTFIDFAGTPISGLAYQVAAGARTFSGASGIDGQCPALQGLTPGLPLEIRVRKEDGSFATKYRGEVQTGDMDVCAVSPSIRLPITTQLHQGTPAKPPVAASSNARHGAHGGTPTGVQPQPNAPPVGHKPSGLAPAQIRTRSCRNEQGHPEVGVIDKLKDWAHRHRIPTFGLWSWKDFQSDVTSCTRPLQMSNPKPGGAQDIGPVGPEGAPANNGTPRLGPPRRAIDRAVPAPTRTPAPRVSSPDQPPPKEVTELMTAMEQQVTWPWKSLPSTAAIVSAISAGTFKYPEASKPAGKSNGSCYKSVKVGLWRAGHVEGINGDVPARTAGKWLLAQGYEDVTASLPDARWAWPGDVIVYKYPEAKTAARDEAERKKYQQSLVKYQQEKLIADQKMALWLEEKNNFDISKKNWESAHPGKKYPSKFTTKAPKAPSPPHGPEDTNWGHIDVRTYDGYASDMFATRLPDATKFEVTGIYRKHSDPLPDVRLKAFLKILREWECHEEIDDTKRYFMLGMNLKVSGRRTFSDTEKHPFEETEIKKNNPAGAYQILLSTYRLYTVSRLGIGAGFSPENQDRLAAAIIEECKALASVRRGNIREAVKILATSNQFSSLPGGKDARKELRKGIEYRYTEDDVIASFLKNMKESASP